MRPRRTFPRKSGEGLERSAGGGKRRGAQPPEPAQGLKQAGPKRLVGPKLEVALAGVAGELAGQTEEPGAEPVGRGRAPGTREALRADRMEDLIGEGAQVSGDGINSVLGDA